MRIHPVLTILAAASLLLVSGCNGKDSVDGAGNGDGDAEVIRMGVAGPITGGQAKNGKDLVDGCTLAVEEWNAKGGVLGKQVELLAKDDEALDKNATVVAGELVDAGVAGVIGHFNSGCTIPSSEEYHRAGIPCITPASTNTYVTDRKYPDVFRVCGRDDQQGNTAAKFLSEVYGAKRVAVYDDKTAYGKGLADMMAKGLEGKAEVVIREGFDVTERNFRPYLTKLKEAKVDVWYFGGIYEQAAPMLLQARQLGITAPMMSGDGVHGYQQDFLDKVGDGATGTLTTFPDTTANPGYKEFVEKYRKRFKGDPGPYAIYSYAAANILLSSIEKAGTTDGPKVCEAIRGSKHVTTLGSLEFDAKGDVKALDYYSIWTVKDGKHVLYTKE